LFQGYFRKAEVEFSTFHFSDALISYRIALKLQPNDPDILKAILRTSQQKEKDRKGNTEI
jgi:cytochrome c-type biogenesis protein CcmH/NrfG